MMNDPVVNTTSGEAISNNLELAATQGLEEICLIESNVGAGDNNNEDECASAEEETAWQENEHSGINFDNEHAVNDIDDLNGINFRDLSAEEFVKFHFPDVGQAFKFYNRYACMHGFSARKSKVLRNRNGEIIQQRFVCHKQGHRVEKDNNNSSEARKREPRPLTRCGCEARTVVHVEVVSRRWYIKYFNDMHNHTPIDDKYTWMLPAHRNISEHQKSQMISMREVGIRTPHIYGWLASQAGGYENLGFLKRDVYNEQFNPKRTQFSDASVALEYLESMGLREESLFWRHTVDEEGQLEHLFWCDGVSRGDYSVFGDVLAFDATYRKNKYLLPFVVFSGVNHHNMSIVFGSAIVGNETEETYVWLLQQFLEAMGGKSPMSVITDGDQAMRNAIRIVFPRAHHRLCAWHLIRNAVSNVKNPRFVAKFKQCMLGDFDIAEFNHKWEKLVAEFGLEENNWVLQLYERRSMWATAYIRGNFFAGFRTTSRCEGLHSEFGKYVTSKVNLVEFIQHFFRWMAYMRYREVEADFSSLREEPVLKTPLKYLEMSAASLYTREVFMLFRPVLHRACTCNVECLGRTGTCYLYKVSRYIREGCEWLVTFDQTSLEFKCSCQRLESLGIPCEHIIVVFKQLNIVILPDCVVLKRWTKSAKDSIPVANRNASSSADSGLWSQYVYLVDNCNTLCKTAYESGSSDYMRSCIDVVRKQTVSITMGQNTQTVGHDGATQGDTHGASERMVRDPARVRRKGQGGPSSSSHTTGKHTRKIPTCGACGGKGHKKNVCPVQRDIDLTRETQVDSSNVYDDDDHDYEVDNVNMNV